MPSVGYPKYFVFYCAMDPEARANPLGHASLLLLKQEFEKAPIRVIDAKGFYSQPSTTTNLLYRALKYILGFNIDLQDIHGVLKQEAMHDLDGNGLNGINFEVTKEKFERLIALITQKKELEEKAIEETNTYINRQNQCDLVSVSILPNKDNLDDLQINSDAAYVQLKYESVNRLFYIRKSTKECVEITLTLKTLKRFDSQMQASTQAKTLTEADLKNIKSITGHAHQVKAINAHTRYTLETSWATAENRPSRLPPFHISIVPTRKGIDSSASHGCKNYALNLLMETEIIDAETRDQIIGTATNHAFPLFTITPLTPFRLVSTGEPEKNVSARSGAVHYNRKWGGANEIFLATPLPPQSVAGHTTDLEPTHKLYQPVKSILTRTQEIEFKIREKLSKLDSPENRQELKQFKEQLQEVQKIYKEFSDIYTNQPSQGLPDKLLRAEETLRVASLYLARDKMNYPFMLRAFESLVKPHLLLSLLCVIIAIVFLSNNPLGTTLLAGPTGYNTGLQIYRFFKAEQTLSKMRSDYKTHVAQRGTGEDSKENTATETTINPSNLAT